MNIGLSGEKNLDSRAILFFEVTGEEFKLHLIKCAGAVCLPLANGIIYPRCYMGI